jgi:hypothetical protein
MNGLGACRQQDAPEAGGQAPLRTALLSLLGYVIGSS